MNSEIVIVAAATRLQDLPSGTDEVFLVADKNGAVEGAFVGERLTGIGDANPNAAVGDVAQRDYMIVLPEDSVWNVVAAMRSTDSAFALVASHDGDRSASAVRGFITRKSIMDVLAEDMELFGVQGRPAPLDEHSVRSKVGIT